MHKFNLTECSFYGGALSVSQSPNLVTTTPPKRLDRFTWNVQEFFSLKCNGFFERIASPISLFKSKIRSSVRSSPNLVTTTPPKQLD